MATVAKKIYQKTGLDSSIVFSILAKVVQGAGAVFTLFLITRFLGINEQGYYYTFASILAIQVFFELGLTTIITQYIAHEAAHLSWKNNDELEGDDYYLSRLTSILHLSVKWFLVVFIILLGVLLLAGNYFFSTFHSNLNVEWQVPWVVLSIAASFILLLDLFFAILEGLGKIRSVTRLRLVQQVCNLLLVSAFLLGGLNLLSGGLALLLSTCATFVLLFFSGYWKVLEKIWQRKMSHRIDYKKEMLPYHFKIGAGYISSYLILQLINPVLFATQGPVIAGQMGSTQAVLNGIFVISLSWVTTKVALFSTLVSKRELGELNSVYNKTLRISFLVFITGLMIFMLLAYLLKHNYPQLGERFLGMWPILFLGLTQLANVIGSFQGFYLRSFKEEPFFITSITVGILSAISTIVFSKYFGINEIIFSYFIINGVIGFIWGCIIFNRKKYKKPSEGYSQTGNL